MPVAYTAVEIEEMQQKLESLAPPFPVTADYDTAPAPTSLTTAGSELGLLINLAAQNGRTQKLFLNPVLAQQLLWAIGKAADVSDWWDDNGKFNTEE